MEERNKASANCALGKTLYWRGLWSEMEKGRALGAGGQAAHDPFDVTKRLNWNYFSLFYRSLPRLPSYLFYLSIMLACLQQVSKALVVFLWLTLKDLRNFLFLCTCMVLSDCHPQHPTS